MALRGVIWHGLALVLFNSREIKAVGYILITRFNEMIVLVVSALLF